MAIPGSRPPRPGFRPSSPGFSPLKGSPPVVWPEPDLLPLVASISRRELATHQPTSRGCALFRQPTHRWSFIWLAICGSTVICVKSCFTGARGPVTLRGTILTQKTIRSSFSCLVADTCMHAYKDLDVCAHPRFLTAFGRLKHAAFDSITHYACSSVGAVALPQTPLHSTQSWHTKQAEA
jgi:hypothetical protein